MSLPLHLLSPNGSFLGRDSSGTGTVNDNQAEAPRIQVEDYPAGLPRFASLIGSHPSFNVCRRFSKVRARLFLLKQDKVSVLEKKLMAVDANEARPLFLGSSRRDANAARITILAELDTALRDLDEFVLRSYQMAEMPPAPRQVVTSLRNWVEGNGCVAREETEFLNYEHDLFTTAKGTDGAMSLLQPWIEDTTVRIYELFRKVHDPELPIHKSIFTNTSVPQLIFHAMVTFTSSRICIKSGYSNVNCMDPGGSSPGTDHRHASYLEHSASCFMYFLFADLSSSWRLVFEQG